MQFSEATEVNEFSRPIEKPTSQPSLARSPAYVNLPPIDIRSANQDTDQCKQRADNEPESIRNEAVLVKSKSVEERPRNPPGIQTQ